MQQSRDYIQWQHEFLGDENSVSADNAGEQIPQKAF